MRKNKRSKILDSSASESGAEGSDGDDHPSRVASNPREEFERASSSSPPPPSRIVEEEASEENDDEEEEDEDAVLNTGAKGKKGPDDSYNDIDTDYNDFYYGDIMVRV